MLPVSRFISSRWNFNCFSNASVVGKSRWNQLQASSLFGQRLQRAHLVDFHRDVFESGRPSEIDSEWFRCLFLMISIWYWYVLIKYLMNKNHAASKPNLKAALSGIWVPVSLWALTAQTRSPFLDSVKRVVSISTEGSKIERKTNLDTLVTNFHLSSQNLGYNHHLQFSTHGPIRLWKASLLHGWSPADRRYGGSSKSHQGWNGKGNMKTWSWKKGKNKCIYIYICK